MGRKPYRRAELISKLRKLAARLGHTPAQQDVNLHPDYPCHATYVNHFGSWNAAITAAGLPLNRSTEPCSSEELKTILQQLVEELGRAPTHRDLAERRLPTARTFARYLGDWREALMVLGACPRSAGPHCKYSKNELKQVLRQLADEIGHPPTQAELDAREDLPHSSTYKTRFGGWNAALQAAGLKPRYFRP
jgi:hypothetical protein